MSIKMTTPQVAALENAKTMSEQGLYYCPLAIGGHSAARALVRRGLLFIKRGVRHQETGEEVTGYGVVGLSYPDEAPVSTPTPSPLCGAIHRTGVRCTMFKGHATAYHTATGFGREVFAQWYDDGRDL